ncbi:hypothetical protein RCL_jg1418.t1 [Rhizophagus clarus]|uniref:Uncharacterized protein n=1 Tax=Rhizophagus clarus TaxID=94130 RepID=A0A8H3QS91_9GLOM|nr:hypothetical protein RCL_jg1418.t1 [Rhizophagus clarus]
MNKAALGYILVEIVFLVFLDGFVEELEGDLNLLVKTLEMTEGVLHHGFNQIVAEDSVGMRHYLREILMFWTVSNCST